MTRNRARLIRSILGGACGSLTSVALIYGSPAPLLGVAVALGYGACSVKEERVHFSHYTDQQLLFHYQSYLEHVECGDTTDLESWLDRLDDEELEYILENA
jgi:hypothetical protein